MKLISLQKKILVVLCALSSVYGKEEFTPLTEPRKEQPQPSPPRELVTEPVKKTPPPPMPERFPKPLKKHAQPTTPGKDSISKDCWFLDFKLGYFGFQDKRARKIYDTGGFIFRAEANYRISTNLLVWLDGGYFTKNGHSLGLEHLSTTFQTGTITLGIKGIWFWKYAALYAGVGPRLFFLSLINQSPYVKYRQHSVGLGGGGTTGILIFPLQHAPGYLDLFLDYSLKTCHFANDGQSSVVRHKIAVGGLSTGIGLGAHF